MARRLLLSLLALSLSVACACQTDRDDAPNKPSAAEQPTPPQSLYVVHSAEATLSSGMLTLTGVSPAVIAFTDQPDREFSLTTLEDLKGDWAQGIDSFADVPPNAIFDGTYTQDDGTTSQCSIEVELMGPPVPGASGQWSWPLAELTRFDGCPASPLNTVSLSPSSIFIELGRGHGSINYEDFNQR